MSSCYQKCLQYYYRLVDRWDAFRAKNHDVLDECNERTSLFSLRSKVFHAKIIAIESFTDMQIGMVYGGRMQRFLVRLESVVRPITIDPITVTKYLPQNNRVTAVAGDFDVDGRLLVTLYNNSHQYRIGDLSINELVMMANGLELRGNTEDAVWV
jgi:hypothetical protein